MTPGHAPRFATWLLIRLTAGPQRTALAGDLIEQYQHRRSPVWYWSQVLTAIGVGAVHDLGDHLMLALRAIAMWYVLSWAAAWATTVLHQALGLIVWNWTVSHDLDMLRVAWFGRPRFGSPLLMAAACVNAMWIGWIVVRLHRRHAAATLLSCVAFITLYAMFVLYAWTMMWPLRFFVIAAFVSPQSFLVALLGVPASFLIGGVLGSDPGDRMNDQVLVDDQ